MQSVPSSTLRKWASVDLSCIGSTDARTLVSLNMLIKNYVVGVQEIYGIDMSESVIEWANTLDTEIAKYIVCCVSACEGADYKSPITDLLRKGEVVELPTTLKHNDRIPCSGFLSIVKEVISNESA